MPTRTQAGPLRRFRCSSRPWRAGNEYYAPITPVSRPRRRTLAEPNPTADRVAGAIPPAEQAVAAPQSQLPDRAVEKALPGGIRRPPAHPARRVVPVGFRRPPADPARQPRLGSAARPSAKLTGHPVSRTQDSPRDVQYDRDVAAAITAGDPAGIAMAYDRYAAALYGYCHWMLHDSADAARALQDTFVVAATLSGLSEPAKLRPWLFALARNQCRRQIKHASAARNQEADAAPQQADPVGQPSYATREATDATVQFRAVGQLPDATVQFRAVGQLPDATRAATPFRAVSQLPDATREAADATVQFRVVRPPGRPVRRSGQRQRRPGASRTPDSDRLHPGGAEASRTGGHRAELPAPPVRRRPGHRSRPVTGPGARPGLTRPQSAGESPQCAAHCADQDERPAQCWGTC